MDDNLPLAAAFGAWLYNTRRSNCVSRRELARHGLSSYRVREWESARGAHPSRDECATVARVLGVDVDQALLAAGYAPTSVLLADLLATLAVARAPTSHPSLSVQVLRAYGLERKVQRRLAELMADFMNLEVG